VTLLAIARDCRTYNVPVVAPDDILGYYRMIEKIGAGGMGEVWKAEDTRLGRIVAIKILPPAVAADHEAIGRMRREARTAAQINHPNIATIYSFEEIGERLFIVEEFVEGEPLTKMIARGGIAEADLCRIGRDVAEALAEAHKKGIIHRDIKPDNIIVAGRRVKVLDFGIAKQIIPQAGANDPTAFMTQQGMIIGTVHYMSPEQALGKTVDAGTDIFSLGVVLYQAATGRLPFKGETVTETITQIVRDEPPDPATLNRSLSPAITTIIARCLRKAREQRFASAGDLASALDAQLAKASTSPMTGGAATSAPTVLTGSKLKTVVDEPPKKRRSFAWLGWVTAIVVGVVVAIAIASRQRTSPAPALQAPLANPPVASAPPSSTVSVTAPTVTITPIVPEPTATVADVPVASNATPKPEPPPKTIVEPEKPTADQLFAEGVNELVAGHDLKARRAFAAAVTADPQNKKAHLGLAITNRNWNYAKQLAREIYADNPNDPDLQTLRRFIQEVEQKREQKRPFRGRRFPH
jgi:serine/threonine protein kinase